MLMFVVVSMRMRMEMFMRMTVLMNMNMIVVMMVMTVRVLRMVHLVVRNFFFQVRKKPSFIVPLLSHIACQMVVFFPFTVKQIVRRTSAHSLLRDLREKPIECFFFLLVRVHQGARIRICGML